MQVRIKVRMGVVKAESRQLSQKIVRIVDKEIKTSLRMWLKVILSKVPTYTGTARGTFRPAGRVARLHVDVGAISPVARKKKYIYIKGKRYKTGFDAGKNYAKASLEKSVQHRLILYTFRYENNLPYVLWNDLYPAPPGFTLPSNPPWGVLKPAAEAFHRDVRVNVSRRLRELNLTGTVTYKRAY